MMKVDIQEKEKATMRTLIPNWLVWWRCITMQPIGNYQCMKKEKLFEKSYEVEESINGLVEGQQFSYEQCLTPKK